MFPRFPFMGLCIWCVMFPFPISVISQYAFPDSHFILTNYNIHVCQFRVTLFHVERLWHIIIPDLVYHHIVFHMYVICIWDHVHVHVFIFHLSFFISQLFIFHFPTCHLSFIRSPFIICSVSYVQFLSPVYEISYTSYNVSCFQMCNTNILVVMYHDVLFVLSALLL